MAQSAAPVAGSARCIECFAALAPGQRLERWTYAVDASPGANEVDVEITHCGVCHSDIHQIDNAWGVASFPLVPGHEIVGRVVAVGEGVGRFQIGEAVAIGVQRGSCGSCSCCLSGMDNVCAKILKTYAGLGNDRGGFAKVIRFPSRWIFKCPSGLRAEHIAPLMCAGITVFSPLKRFLLAVEGGPQGKRVGIIGIGGLGHLGVQFAAKMGATVVAISRTDAKAAEARGLGAHDFLASRDAESMSAAAGTFDVLLNTVSSTEDLDAYIGLLKPRGVMACVGLPEKTEKTRLFLHPLVLQERIISGSYLGPSADYAEMLDFACAHNIRPMVELYPVAQINDAIERVKQNQARYRCVLLMEELHWPARGDSKL